MCQDLQSSRETPRALVAATVLLSSGSTSHDWHLNLSVNLRGLDNFGQWARARFVLLCLGATVGNLLRHPFPQPPGTAQEHCVLREELIWASRSSLGRCSVGAWQPQTTRPQVKGQGGTEPTRRGSGSLWSQEETDGTLKWGRREFNKETIYKGTERKLGEPTKEDTVLRATAPAPGWLGLQKEYSEFPAAQHGTSQGNQRLAPRSRTLRGPVGASH